MSQLTKAASFATVLAVVVFLVVAATAAVAYRLVVAAHWMLSPRKGLKYLEDRVHKLLSIGMAPRRR